MADVKIPDFSAGELTDPEDDDLIVIDEDSTGETKYIKHKNLLKRPGFVNLLGNSSFVGIWSNSDTNKGLGIIVYDNLAGGTFSAGDTITGVTSGAVCKVISDNGTTTMVVGAVTGTFQDGEQIGNGAVTADVDGDTAIGVKNDPMNNDSTGDWTEEGANITLADNVGAHTVTTNAAVQRAWIAAAALTVKKSYTIELDINDGTAAGANIELYFDDGAAQYGSIETTQAAWATGTISATFECATTTGAGKVGFRIPTSLAGNNIQIRRFSCYETTPCCTGADALGPDGWRKDTTLDLYREHHGANVPEGVFYSTLSVPTAQNDFCLAPAGYYNDEKWFEPAAGGTYTIAAYVKSSTASDFRVTLSDGVATTYSSYHSGGGAFEWLEISATMNANPTEFTVGWHHGSATPGNAYIGAVMLIKGSAIGEGNYLQRPQIATDPIWDAAGDLIQGTGDDTAARLAIGAANLKLFVNAAGNAVEWAVGIKLGTFTRNTADANGDQVVSGVEFKPSHVVFLANVDGSGEVSIGFGDGTLNYAIASQYASTAGDWTPTPTKCIELWQTAAILYRGALTALGADGFTITWTKTGAKIGMATVYYLAFR